MLRYMGNYQQNHELSVKDLSDTKWKQLAKQVLDGLLKGSPADFTQAFDELVIVPDGALWYLPFEALQVTVGGRSQPLIARFRIRYAPTLSLSVMRGPGRGPADNTVVLLGKLMLKGRGRPHTKSVRSVQRGRTRHRGAAIAATSSFVGTRLVVPAAGRI